MTEPDDDGSSFHGDLNPDWEVFEGGGTIPKIPEPGYPVLFPVAHNLTCGEINTPGRLDGRHLVIIALVGELGRAKELDDEGSYDPIGTGANYLLMTLDQVEEFARDLGGYVVMHRAAGYR